MKNKKGFTLIELLAVIVILAIIALIATPIILNMINDARKNSAKSSALGYIDAIEYNNGFAQLGTADINGTYEEIKTGDVTTANQKLGNHLKGKAPTSGTVTIDSKGKVTAADFCINGYNVTYNGTDAKVNGKCNGSNNNEPVTYTAYNPGDIVYFDPVSTDKCDSTEFNIDNIKNNTSTCYKWRIITVGDTTTDDTVTIQMDHNLTANTRWAPGSDNSTGPSTAMTALANATSTWTRVDPINYEYDTTLNGANTGYNYGVLTCTDGICNRTKNNSTTLVAGTTTTPVRARMITGEEIKAIVMEIINPDSTSYAAKWKLSDDVNDMYYYLHTGTRTQGTEAQKNSIKWMYENTKSNSSGATNNAYGSNTDGYWTLSSISSGPGGSDADWVILYSGYLGGDGVYKTSLYGVRPVITIEKSKLK